MGERDEARLEQGPGVAPPETAAGAEETDGGGGDEGCACEDDKGA